MTPDDKKIRKSDDAKMLLKNPLITEALNDLRKMCFENIESSGYQQSDEREELYLMLRCITQFERKLKSYIQTGNVALNNLNIKKIIR